MKRALAAVWLVLSLPVLAQNPDGPWRGEVGCSAFLPEFQGSPEFNKPYRLSAPFTVNILGPNISGSYDHPNLAATIRGTLSGDAISIIFDARRKDRPTIVFKLEFTGSDFTGNVKNGVALLNGYEFGGRGTRKSRECTLRLTSEAFLVQQHAAKEKADQERAAQMKAAADRAAQEQAERVAQEKAAKETAERELRAVQEQLARERAARVAAERKAVAADKAVADKAAADKAAADKAVADKAVADKAAADKAAADKAAAEKSAAMKAAADKAAKERSRPRTNSSMDL